MPCDTCLWRLVSLHPKPFPFTLIRHWSFQHFSLYGPELQRLRLEKRREEKAENRLWPFQYLKHRLAWNLNYAKLRFVIFSALCWFICHSSRKCSILLCFLRYGRVRQLKMRTWQPWTRLAECSTFLCQNMIYQYPINVISMAPRSRRAWST